AAGAPWDRTAYWGYRMIEVSGDGRVSAPPWDGPRGMLSVPAGNVWVEETASTPGKKVVVNALPRPVEVNLRFRLPVRAEGYRFAGGTVVDVGDGGTYLARATAAPSGARTVVEAMPATGNAPPRILVEPLTLGDEATVRLT